MALLRESSSLELTFGFWVMMMMMIDEESKKERDSYFTDERLDSKLMSLSFLCSFFPDQMTDVWGSKSTPFMQALHFSFSFGKSFLSFIICDRQNYSLTR